MGNSIFDGIEALGGGSLDASQLENRVVLVVNVASRCGMAPQYEELERLQRRFGERGFTVLGVPCDQFAGQELGSAEEILEFCSATYGTTFPLTEKLAVNGDRRHRLFDLLSDTTDEEGRGGEIEWNFEKFLVSREGRVLSRFRPAVPPESDAVVAAIEVALEVTAPRVVRAEEVRVGDRLRTSAGIALLVTRIEPGLNGDTEVLSFVEDSKARWMKLPVRRDAEVELSAEH